MSLRLDTLKCFRERRACWWCHADFMATRRELVYCCATCGRAARGLDAHGRPVRRVA